MHLHWVLIRLYKFSEKSMHWSIQFMLINSTSTALVHTHINKIYSQVCVFSSSKLEAHWWAFVIACPSVCNYNNYKSSSSPEPLGQFQPNLAWIILMWRGYIIFTQFPMGDDRRNNENTSTTFQSLLLNNHALMQGQIQPN